MDNVSSKRSDKELLRAAQSGDQFAMEELLIRYKPMVKNKAGKMFIMRADYEDVIQEGMIGLFKAIREFDPDRNAAFSSFAVYCVTSSINDAVKSALRKKHKPLNTSLSFSNISEDDSYDLLDVYIDLTKTDPEEILISSEEKQSLEEFMGKKLSKHERETLLLFIQGYSYAEIAQKLNKTSKSIDGAMQRARLKFEEFKK